METDTQTDSRDSILAKAKSLGASLAGIASIDARRRSPSYAIYHETPYYDGYETAEWSAEAKSVLVLGLRHHPSEPALDRWGDIPGITPVNSRLMQIAGSLKEQLARELNIGARPLPFRLEQGGILLKDSTVLAGRGVIGKNNLVITPEYGPRLRLRWLFLGRDIEATGPSRAGRCLTSMSLSRSFPRPAWARLTKKCCAASIAEKIILERLSGLSR